MPANRPRRHKEPETPDPSPSKGRLNNLELTGIGLICFAVLLFGISRCNQQPDPPSPVAQPTITEQVVDTVPTPPPPPPAPAVVLPDSILQKRKLYVLADSLRLRTSPELSSTVVTYLSYGEEVIDLNETTEPRKIRVSVDEVRTAPWVKIRTKSGKTGWAFGAYLQFYPAPSVEPTAEGANAQ